MRGIIQDKKRAYLLAPMAGRLQGIDSVVLVTGKNRKAVIVDFTC